MSSISTSTNGSAPALHKPGAAFGSVLNAAVGMAIAKLEQKVAVWTDKANGGSGEEAAAGGLTPIAEEGIDQLTEGGGAAEKAGAEGVKAKLEGKNPIWAAIKGAWDSGTPVVRAAIITAGVSAVVLLLVSPVLLVIFLLSLLVVSAFHRGGSAKEEHAQGAAS